MPTKKAVSAEKKEPTSHPMHIALVAPYAEPEKGACTLRVKSLQGFLEAKGHAVEVFAPARGNQMNVKGIHRYASIPKLMQAIMGKKFDAVWGTSPPMTHSFFAGVAAKLSGAKFVVDARDPWTYVLDHSSEYQPQSLKRGIFKLIEFFSYLISDQIWVVSPGIKSIIANASQHFAKKTHIIPNGTIPTLFHFSASGRTRLRKQWGLKKDEVLAIYAGGFVEWEVDRMLESLVPLVQSPHFRLLFLIPFGKSADGKVSRTAVELDKLQQIVHAHHLSERVIFVDEKDVPFTEMSDYFSAADVGLATVPEALSYCIRVKTYDYAAAGLPVAAKGPQNGSLKDIMNRTGIGTYAHTWDEFALQLKHFTQKYSTTKSQREEIMEIARREFDRNISNASAERLLHGMLKQ